MVKGFVGQPPKTAWVIDYPLLERIHYLLVAGFDVYGNGGHQLETRLYMDFLRMEGEVNFLTLLPRKNRKAIHEYWYRDASERVQEYIYDGDFLILHESDIQYGSANPQLELFQLLNAYLKPVLNNRYSLMENVDAKVAKALSQLEQLRGAPVTIQPNVAFLMVEYKTGQQQVFSLIKNSAHSNVVQLFEEQERRLPAEDRMTV